MHIGLATECLNSQLVSAQIFLVGNMERLMNVTNKVKEQSHCKKSLLFSARWILQNVAVLVDGRNNLQAIRTIAIHIKALCSARHIDVVERLEPVILSVTAHLVGPHCGIGNGFIAKNLP